MSALKYHAIHLAMEVFALPGVAALIRQFSASKGIIFTLHRVLPSTPAEFSPNAILQITPDFLEQTILRCRHLGVDIVDLDEALRRLKSTEKENRFAVFTFDDGYRDNLRHALPVLRKHNCPFALFIAPNLTSATAEIWWQALEDIIGENDEIKFDLGEGEQTLESVTIPQKNAAFDHLYWYMRNQPEEKRLALLHQLAHRYGLDLTQHCRALIMDWEELQIFVDEPLCTIGAHTMNHPELAKLPEHQMRGEILQSVEVLGEKLGKKPSHFSYPLGGPASAAKREFDAVKSMDITSGVTTRPGGLYAENAQFPNALPRVSLNGKYQKRRFLDVFLTGAIFTAHSGMKKVNLD
ncbi:polysaccharide deacetylase family protein [Maritalea sp.]|uniref:polysaccharide deacetylase family protein n=1 Tax=Maritalea sp. TaxID=2003361 RepID=UPI003EFAB4E2